MARRLPADQVNAQIDGSIRSVERGRSRLVWWRRATERPRTFRERGWGTGGAEPKDEGNSRRLTREDGRHELHCRRAARVQNLVLAGALVGLRRCGTIASDVIHSRQRRMVMRLTLVRDAVRERDRRRRARGEGTEQDGDETHDRTESHEQLNVACADAAPPVDPGGIRLRPVVATRSRMLWPTRFAPRLDPILFS